MEEVLKEVIEDLAELGLEFVEIPAMFLPENNELEEPTTKKAKILEVDQKNDSDLINNEENQSKFKADESNKPEDEEENSDNNLEDGNEKNESDKQDNEEKVPDNLEEVDEDLLESDAPEEGKWVMPIEYDASDMLEGLDFPDGRFPSVTERYLTPYYQINVQSPGDDICIFIHSNRICMITLAPSHIIFKENKIIENVNYKVSEKLDRTQNKLSGKSKHGAQPLQSNSNLCCISCTDGTKYMIKCCMIGKLIEVNEGLISFPDMLKLEPHFGGYIAIVLPNLKHLDKLQEKLLNQKQYEEAIKKRIEIDHVDGDKNEKKDLKEERSEIYMKLLEKLHQDEKNLVEKTELPLEEEKLIDNK